MKKIFLIFLILLMPSISFAQIRGVIVKDGKAVNVVILPQDWTGAAGEWQPTAGSTVVTGQGGEVGDDYNGTNFIKYVFVNRDPQTNEITRVTKKRMGPAQTRVRANHAGVLAYRADQNTKDSWEELIEIREKKIIRDMAIKELQAEGKLPIPYP